MLMLKTKLFIIYFYFPLVKKRLEENYWERMAQKNNSIEKGENRIKRKANILCLHLALM